jgi:hypothetical protein
MIYSLKEGVPRESTRRLLSPREASLISDSAQLGIFGEDVIDAGVVFGEPFVCRFARLWNIRCIWRASSVA